MAKLRRWLRGGLLATVVIGVAAFFLESSAVERDLTARVAERLAADGATWAAVTVTGRDVVVSGTAPSTDAVEFGTRDGSRDERRGRDRRCDGPAADRLSLCLVGAAGRPGGHAQRQRSLRIDPELGPRKRAAGAAGGRDPRRNEARPRSDERLQRRHGLRA